MKDLLRDKTNGHLRLIIVSLCAAIFWLTMGSSSAEAGPLLDWLFQRNRSQNYAGAPGGYANGYGANGYGTSGQNAAGYGQPYTSNYGMRGQQQNAYRTNGYQPSANTARSANANQSFYRGQSAGLFPKCGLFGRGRSLFGKRDAGVGLGSNANPNGNQLAGNQGRNFQYGQTAAYGGGGSCPVGCQSGWCQQTVLRYMPQIAYRTDYQPVPVTTYKTTTTINPANNLPRTCTRPCTSYSWQARRVPYTTYRPVYTSVPVADDCGCNANAGYTANPNAANPNAANPNAANIAPQLPPSSGWQPVPSAAGAANPLPSQFPNQVQANRVFQPIPNAANSGWVAGGGCNSCQNSAGFQQGFSPSQGFGGTNGQYRNPAYAPGGAGVSPMAPQAGPWSSQPLDNAPRATPWQPVDQFSDSPTTSGFRGDTPRPSPWRRVPRGSYARRADADFGQGGGYDDFDSSSDEYSDSEIPWQRVPSSGSRPSGPLTSTPATVRGNEANQRPRIDPNVNGYRGDYADDTYGAEPRLLRSQSNRPTTRLVPVPKPGQRVPELAPQSVMPLYNSDPSNLGDQVQVDAGRPAYEGGYEATQAYGGGTTADLNASQPLDAQMFGTPGTPAAGGVFHSTNDNFETRRETDYRTKAIHDNIRGGPSAQQDKTASEALVPTSHDRRRDTRWTTRREIVDNKVSRFAAVDIEWDDEDANWVAR